MSFFKNWSIKSFQDDYLEIYLPSYIELYEKKPVFYLHDNSYLTCFVHPADPHCLFLDCQNYFCITSYLSKQKVNASLLKSWLLKMLEVYEATNQEVVMDQLSSVFLDHENHDLHFIKLPVKPVDYHGEKAFLNCFWELLENIDFDGDEAWLSNLYMLSRQKVFHFSMLRKFLEKKAVKRRFPFWFKKPNEEENEFFQAYQVHEQMVGYQEENEEKTTLLSDDLKTQVLMSGFQFGYLEDQDHQLIFISQTPWLIGRKETCQLRLTYPEISKEHAQLIIENGLCYVVDLNSTNHTSLNDRVLQPLNKEPLADGDRLSFAGHLYIYHV